MISYRRYCYLRFTTGSPEAWGRLGKDQVVSAVVIKIFQMDLKRKKKYSELPNLFFFSRVSLIPQNLFLSMS